MPATHVVYNVVENLENYNLFAQDPVLQANLQANGGAAYTEACQRFGQKVGSEEAIRWGFEADANTPVLRTYDRRGRRQDIAEYHPAYHALMTLSLSEGLHSLACEAQAAPGVHVGRAALFYMAAQNELGHGCPISMTWSVIPVLRREPALRALWEPKITRHYDPRVIPANEKIGVIFGMAMTEKQGGSDVRANSTRAVPVAGAGRAQEYLLTGHKWFCSAPNSDAFCVLAQAEGGLSCFLVPRFRPDGSKNNLMFQRLKNKLGNRANASSEVEYDQTSGWLMGEEGRGVATIIEMVNHTRLDCAIGASALMRAGLVQALHHSRHRAAFGQTLQAHPLMQNVLGELALESEAALSLVLRLARSFDRANQDAHEAAFRRIATPIAKYWLCKRVVPQVAEALECLGGGGYVEESLMPRLHRESPLYSIWEGSGNVICLDVLRAMARSPESIDALRVELAKVQGIDSRYDQAVAQVFEALQGPQAEGQARMIVEQLAILLQSALLLKNTPENVAIPWLATRLGGEGGRCFGTLPAWVRSDALMARAWVDVK